MLIKNPKSKRNNPFKKIYDNDKYKYILRYKDKLPKFPYLVDIELTNFCNLRCIFCGQQAMTRKKGFMTEKIFKKVIDECAKYKTPIRFARWGEPFVHPKIINFCKYIKSKGLLIHITNNGLFIKESDMKALVKLEVNSLVFSFQGATKKEYEKMRNNHRYDDLKSNILKIIKIRGNREKPFIHVSSTMTNESKKQINAFVNYWVNIVDSVGIGKTNLSRLNTHQIKSFKSIDKLAVLKKQETIKKYYRPCTEVYQKLSIDWDGKITCCCGDYDNFLVVGNLKQESLFDIWNKSKELKTFRGILDKSMHKCLTLCSTCYHTYDEF